MNSFLRHNIGLSLLALSSTIVIAEEPLSLDNLLKRVEAGYLKDSEENKQREATFLKEEAQQEALIREAQAEITALEKTSSKLEQQFNTNDLEIKKKRAQRDERLGSLKELFGNLTSTAGDMRSRFKNSITSSQFKDRNVFLSNLIKKMNSDTDLPTLEEIEQIWYELHREMTESGRIVSYSGAIETDPEREVVRIGLFNLISNGEYLAYEPDTQSVSVLPRQPVGLAENASALQTEKTGIKAIGIDPTGAAGGGYLKAIINTPTLEERWHQGRQVGYLITALGCFALLLVLWRFISLTVITIQIQTQLKSKEILPDNTLGRLLQIGQSYSEKNDIDGLETKLYQAILKERPKIIAGLSLLKIIAMIAPLLGLLGTVTGMIIVFQAITIYGAGDPKAMAGGISNALVTTALGLLVAIPTLLAHTLLNGKAQKLLHILEEQSTGTIAERIES